jgi:flagellar protein FlaF
MGPKSKSAPAERSRAHEYRLFARVTAELVRASGRADPAKLSRALNANRRLWDLLSVDCAQEANQLPHSLRAQIVSLALWVSRHTGIVLREGADIGPLIDVNRTIMVGLARG